MNQKGTQKLSLTASNLRLIFAACLTVSLMSAFATRTSAYGPVLLSDHDRAWLSRDAKEKIEANNEAWLRERQ